MPYTMPIPEKQKHQHRFVEYIDIFANTYLDPSAEIRENLLLFDTFDGKNPLEALYYKAPNKMYQKVHIYVMRGEFTIEMNGRDRVINANTLLTIMPENMTRISAASSDLSYFMVVIYPKLFNAVYNDLGLTYSNARLSLRHFKSPLTEEHMEKALQIYKEIKKELLEPNYTYKSVYIKNYLNALTIENINIHDFSPTPLQGNSNSRQYDVYCRFLNLLNKHSIEHRSVQYYANQLGISSKYLSFVCISYSQKNASKWIDESVIQKAKALMVVHHYTFGETIEILHFSTVGSYSRFFKRVTGMSPKEFMRRVQ